MHGYQPVEIVPTTALLLSHKHPEDHPHVARVLDRMINAAEPFSSKHRIVDTAGQVHQVVVVGDRLCYDTGAVIGTTGFYIDLTDSYRDEMKESVDEAVAELEQSRAIIEQAKGALMLVYGIPADRAFDTLIWRSQETNTRLRILAELLVAGFGQCGTGASLRTQFDHKTSPTPPWRTLSILIPHRGRTHRQPLPSGNLFGNRSTDAVSSPGDDHI